VIPLKNEFFRLFLGVAGNARVFEVDFVFCQTVASTRAAPAPPLQVGRRQSCPIFFLTTDTADWQLARLRPVRSPRQLALTMTFALA